MARTKNNKKKRLSSANNIIVTETTKIQQYISSQAPPRLMKKPKKPTPLNLYFAWRMDELLAVGKTKDEVFKTCCADYRDMPEEQKVLWIMQALEKEPAYKVFNITQNVIAQ